MQLGFRMIYYWLIATGLWLLLAPITAVQAELLLSRHFASQALGRAMNYSIYLPPGYDSKSEHTYPTVYLLHGVGDNENAWPKLGKVEATMERLIATEELPPMIVVAPDTGTSWLVDSADVGGPGDYARAVRDDLVAHIDNTYRTIPERRGRAIAGNSMGGFGALRLAFEKPDIYAAVAGLSSALWLRLEDDSVLNTHQEKIFQGSFGTPFDAARFRRLSPISLLDKVKRYNGRLGILLTAGDDDVFRAYRSTTIFYSMLRDADIPAELRIVDGGHTWKHWAQVLPLVLKFFAEEFKRYDK